MKPYRYPQKLRPDVDFTTLRRNLSYITTQIFLRRHVISRALEEKKSLATTRVARDSHYPLIHLNMVYRQDVVFKIIGTLNRFISGVAFMVDGFQQSF